MSPEAREERPTPDPRALLPRAFPVLYGRFRQLRPIQARAIEPIRTGRNVLLMAPTAGGKTEAYLAPLLEGLLRLPPARRAPMHLLVVLPTRALANDLFERLREPLGRAGLLVGRMTSEHKDRQDGQLPHLGLLTPEGLDARLARTPELLQHVQAVVLDELHALDGTPRGDHLYVLLHRLERQLGRSVQRVAASATVPDPARLAHRYLGPQAVVLEGGRGRPPLVRQWEGCGSEDVRRVLAELADRGIGKVLIFTRSRADVDELVTDLRGRTPFGHHVYGHHGSLGRQERELAEEQVKRLEHAVLVATTTLELGIDIGSMQYVLLYGRPPNVASLLQRIGRSGRRGAPARFGYMWWTLADAILYDVMIRHALRGELLHRAPAFRRSVVLQQALSLAGRDGTVDARRLAAELPPEARPKRREELRELLEAAVDAELLDPFDAERFRLGPRAERLWESGRLHGNIEQPPQVELVDAASGRVLAHLDPGFAPKEKAREPSRRTAVKIAGRRMEVHHRKPGQWQLRASPLVDRKQAVPPDYPTVPAPPVSFELARAVVARLGVKEGELVLARSPEGWLLLHGLGTVGARWLAWRLEHEPGRKLPLRPVHKGGWLSPYAALLVVPSAAGPPLRELPALRPDEPRRFLGDLDGVHEKAIARRVGMGPYHRHLPEAQRIESTGRVSGLHRLLNWWRRQPGGAPAVRIAKREASVTALALLDER